MYEHAARVVRRRPEPAEAPTADRGRLVVGAAGAPAEHEADRAAHEVMSTLGVVVPHETTRIRRGVSFAGDHDEHVDADTDARIRRAVGGGQPLREDIRGPMEGAFGRDFSAVRVHGDGESHQLNRRISARAFTVGSDVFLGRGESVADTGVLAHELAHVAQQP